jgi:hypothetical protein
LSYLALLELLLRAGTGHGALTVIPAWFAKGSGVAPLGFVWVVATLGFALAAAAVARGVFVAGSGRSDAWIFLGDRVSEGFHAAREGQRPWNPQFVPRFIATPWSPSATFHAAYRRLWLLEDPEGNLTPLESLRTWRTVSTVLLQGLALGISLMVVIVVAGMFKSGFAQKSQLPAAWAALDLPPAALPLALCVWALLNAAAVVLIRRRGGGRMTIAERALELPASATRRGAVLPGKVVATESYATPQSPRSRAPLQYQRYAVRFDGPDFPLPILVNWQARRILDTNLADAGKRLREQLKRERAANQAAFDVLDAALHSGAAVDFHVTEDLAIVPRIPGIDLSDREADDD